MTDLSIFHDKFRFDSGIRNAKASGRYTVDLPNPESYHIYCFNPLNTSVKIGLLTASLNLLKLGKFHPKPFS